MQVVKVTNHSPMDVKYQWSFIDSAIQFENKDEDEGLFYLYWPFETGSLFCRTALWDSFGGTYFGPSFLFIFMITNRELKQQRQRRLRERQLKALEALY